jgi:putative phosphoesterase
MRILVLSDTHSQPLPKVLEDEFQRADLIIHLGDFTDINLLNRLKAVKEVRAVYGNMDGLDLRQALPKQQVFHCEGVVIGLVHGQGSSTQVLKSVRECFKGEKLDAIVFGHSHVPVNEVIDGILFFNPGSPTDSVRAPFRSYGILEVKNKTIKAQLVKITS